jgi:hypothetical protein
MPDLMLALRRKTKAYAGRHADDERAPTGTECVECGKTEPGAADAPITLARCSACEAWRCTTCFSQHAYTPPAREVGTVRAPWWKRMIGRG